MQIFIVMIDYLLHFMMLSNILIFLLTLIVFIPFKKRPKWRPFLFLILFRSFRSLLFTYLCLCLYYGYSLFRLIKSILIALNGFFTLHTLHFFHQFKNHFFISYLIIIPLIKLISDTRTDFIVNGKSYIRIVTKVQIC